MDLVKAIEMAGLVVEDDDEVVVHVMMIAGATWMTIHGRTPKERTSPVNYDGCVCCLLFSSSLIVCVAAIRLLRECVSIPVIANGDVFSLEDAERIIAQTGVKGVMAARGMLTNPALFAGPALLPFA